MKTLPATPISRHWYEDRKVEPRFPTLYGGVDHGSAGVVLAERRDGNAQTCRLIWMTGHKRAACGVRGFGHIYAPASMTIVNANGYWLGSVLTGGRITAARLAEHAAIIDQIMGAGTTALLDARRTLIVIGEALDDALADNMPTVLKQTA